PRLGGRLRRGRGTALAACGARGRARDTPGARARGARASRRGRAALLGRRLASRRPPGRRAVACLAGAPAPLGPAPEGGHMNALPPTLNRFGAELEDAVRRDLRSRRTRRRTFRGAAVLAVAAATALGLLSVFGSGGP